MDAVEVEEARRPLEDAPLDLNLRGWTPTPVAVEPEEAGADTTDETAPEPEDLVEEEAEDEVVDEAGAAADGEAGYALEEGETGGEPLWLSSLLKQDDEDDQEEVDA
jgi:hypothetical protein